jgi:hypothetical protein
MQVATMTSMRFTKLARLTLTVNPQEYEGALCCVIACIIAN